jgi:hypothetical protein
MAMFNKWWQHKSAWLWERGKKYIGMSARARNHVYLKWVYVRRSKIIEGYVSCTYTGMTHEDELARKEWIVFDGEPPF